MKSSVHYPFIFLVAILLTLGTTTHAARILFFFGGSTYSHRLSVWPLVEALSEKGHDVTFFSSYKPKSVHPKIVEFAPKILQSEDFAFNREFNIVDFRFAGLNENLWELIVYPTGLNLTERILTDPETLRWIENSKFDLVILDNFFNDVAIGLAYKFNAPYIVFGTTAHFMWEYDEFGLPAETSWIPDLQMHYPEDMSLWQRVKNTFGPLRWSFVREWWFLPKVENLLRTALNIPNMPSLRDLHKKVGVVLMNMHYSEEYARSLPPLVVSVGGMHCKNSTKELPKEIEDFIGKSGNQGFIYFSLGSAVKFSHLPNEIRNTIFNSMRDSKTRFIVKWDGSPIPNNFPENIYTANWLPQQDILAHPKIKGFVTHGGILGIHEAVFFGVPLIMFPIFAEQDYNAERAHNGGYGIKLEITTLTQPILESSIRKLLEDSSYKTKISQVSKVFHDRPLEPLNLAVWWTEYVLRHKETPFLKPKSIHQTWYQRRLLDVWALVFLGVTMTFLLTVFIFCKLIGVFSNKDKSMQKSRKLKSN